MTASIEMKSPESEAPLQRKLVKVILLGYTLLINTDTYSYRGIMDKSVNPVDTYEETSDNWTLSSV